MEGIGVVVIQTHTQKKDRHIHECVPYTHTTSKQHSCVQGPLRECRSIRSGPYYCAPLVCVPDVIGVLAVWWHNKPKPKKTDVIGVLDAWRHNKPKTNVEDAYVHVWVRLSTRKNTYLHTHIHTQIESHIHTHIQAYIHARNAHTYTHTLSLSFSLSISLWYTHWYTQSHQTE